MRSRHAILLKNDQFSEYFEVQEIFAVNIAIQDNTPWFKGRDVAERLGYSNPGKAIIMHVEESDRTADSLFSQFGKKQGRPSIYISIDGSM